MRRHLRQFSCLLLLLLSASVLAQSSYTARIPAVIAAGEFAEAEVLITEGLKIGVITALTAEGYRAQIQHAKATSTRKSPKNEPDPRSPSLPPLPPEPDKDPKQQLGRIYVTYTKFNTQTQLYYSGRTSMVIDLAKSLDVQAQQAVDQRDLNRTDENPEPMAPTFTPARVDKYAWGTAIDYQRRYDDVAYRRIRGREQMLIDAFGGAQSDTGKPFKTENKIRGVAKDNPRGRGFYDAARLVWGNKINDKEISYTGND